MKIAFLGDIAFLGQFDKKKNNDVEHKLLFLKEKLMSYDYVIANLESPLTSKNNTLVCKSMHLKADPCNVHLLKYLNISAVSLANNHIADYGIKGLDETINVLDKAGIQWFGARNKTIQIEIKHERISLSGYCCYSTNGTNYNEKKGINLLSIDNLRMQLDKDKKEGKISIISAHWGMEHTNYPAYEHVNLMKKLLGNYQAIVCGHHPHIIQGIQKIEESLVAYSLGNAIFDTCISRNGKLQVELNEDNRRGFIFGVTLKDGRLIDYETNGFYIGKNGIEKLDDIEGDIMQISEVLLQIKHIEQYEAVRNQQFQTVIQSKFGKHDMNWVLSRMNYYALGAKIMGEIRNKKYKKEAEKFKNG